MPSGAALESLKANLDLAHSAGTFIVRVSPDGKMLLCDIVSVKKVTLYGEGTFTGVTLPHTLTCTTAYSGLPTAGTLPGYTFNGWTNGIGTIVTNGMDFVEADNVTALYAKWTANAYAVTFDGNSGSGTMAPQEFAYDVAQALNPNAFVRTGYSFERWTDKATGANYTNCETVSNLAANDGSVVTLTAAWTGNVYKVTFDAQGGTVSPTSKDVTFSVAYGTLPTSRKVGYEFTGWFTLAVGGSEVTDMTMVTGASNHTLWARWVEQPKVAVSFDAMNGAFGNGAEVTTVSFWIGEEYGAAPGALPVPSREKYTFAGWFVSWKDGAAQITEASIAVSTLTKLYAKWAPEVTPAVPGGGEAFILTGNGGGTATFFTNRVTVGSVVLPDIANGDEGRDETDSPARGRGVWRDLR